MKAIETVYKGYRFRSRLEARWAVFFDTLGVEYQYEKEGYDLGGLWYLPDFWLPKQKCWVEIKGQEPTRDEEEKCARLQNHSSAQVHLFVGEIPSIDRPGTVYTYSASENYDSDDPECIKSDEYGWCECPFCGECDITPGCDIASLTCGCFEKCFNIEEMLKFDRASRNSNLSQFIYDRLFCWGNTPLLEAAYTAARQARFEHGERGIWKR